MNEACTGLRRLVRRAQSGSELRDLGVRLFEVGREARAGGGLACEVLRAGNVHAPVRRRRRLPRRLGPPRLVQRVVQLCPQALGLHGGVGGVRREGLALLLGAVEARLPRLQLQLVRCIGALQGLGQPVQPYTMSDSKNYTAPTLNQLRAWSRFFPQEIISERLCDD